MPGSERSRNRLDSRLRRRRRMLRLRVRGLSRGRTYARRRLQARAGRRRRRTFHDGRLERSANLGAIRRRRRRSPDGHRARQPRRPLEPAAILRRVLESPLSSGNRNPRHS